MVILMGMTCGCFPKKNLLVDMICRFCYNFCIYTIWNSLIFLILQEVNLAYENVKEVDGLDVSKEGSDAWEAAIKR